MPPGHGRGAGGGDHNAHQIDGGHTLNAPTPFHHPDQYLHSPRTVQRHQHLQNTTNVLTNTSIKTQPVQIRSPSRRKHPGGASTLLQVLKARGPTPAGDVRVNGEKIDAEIGRAWRAHPIAGSAPWYATASCGTVGGPSPSRAHLGGRIERDVERWGFRGPPLEMSVLISGARAQREDVQITRPRPSLAGHPHRQQRSAHPHHSIAEAQRLSEVPATLQLACALPDVDLSIAGWSEEYATRTP